MNCFVCGEFVICRPIDRSYVPRPLQGTSNNVVWLKCEYVAGKEGSLRLSRSTTTTNVTVDVPGGLQRRADTDADDGAFVAVAV